MEIIFNRNRLKGVYKEDWDSYFWNASVSTRFFKSDEVSLILIK